MNNLFLYVLFVFFVLAVLSSGRNTSSMLYYLETHMQFIKSFLVRPLVRQILGAAGGAAVAVLLYGMYVTFAPSVIQVLHGSATQEERLAAFFDAVAARMGR